MTRLHCVIGFREASIECMSSYYKSHTRVVEDFELACDEARLP